MRFNKKNAPIAIGAVLLILFTISIFTGIIKIPNFAGAAIGTGQVLSLSQVQLSTGGTDGWTTSQVWKAQVLLGSGYDKLSGTVSTGSQQLIDSTNPNLKSQQNLQINYQLTQEKFTYPLVLASAQPQYKKFQGVNFDLRPAYDYGFNLLAGGTHYLSLGCAIDLIFTRNVDGSVGIAVPTSCVPEYQGICSHFGGTALVSTSAINYWGLTSVPTTGWKCLQVVTDTGKPRIDYFRPTQKQPFASANVYVSSPSGQEILSISTTDQVKVSSDQKVRVKMSYGVSSFQTDAPEYSSFYLIRTPAITKPITSAVFSNLPTTNNPVILQIGGSEATAIQQLNQFNDQLDSILVRSQTGFLDTDEINRATIDSQGQNLILDRTNLPTLFPVLDLEMKADFVGIIRPIAIPHISVSPSQLTLTQGGSGATETVSVTREGEGTVYLNPPSCTPSGLTSNPSSTVSRSDASWTQQFIMQGNKGTYSCTVEAYNDDRSSVDRKTFTVSVNQLCTLKPINNQVLDPNTCTLSCPLQCPAGQTLDVNQCLCIAQSNRCSNTCAVGQQQRGYPDCSCYSGQCQPDPTTQFTGANWNTNTCRWECSAGTSPSYGTDGKPYCATSCLSNVQCNNGYSCQEGICKQSTDIFKLLSDNALYIGGGIVILVLLYMVLKPKKGGRRK